MPSRRKFCTSAIALYTAECGKEVEEVAEEQENISYESSSSDDQKTTSLFYRAVEGCLKTFLRSSTLQQLLHYSCVNHEKSKKLSKRASLSSIRIFSKWPRTLAERRPHKTKKWSIVDSILVPHVSSTILIWKQRKTPSNKYERSSGNSKRTSTWGNEQKKGWYRSSSRNART